VPKPRGEYTHWDQNPRRLAGILHWKTFRALQHRVDNALRDRSLKRRETLKVVSPVFSGIGGAIIGAFASWIVQHSER
jgi:hypothetical protein